MNPTDAPTTIVTAPALDLTGAERAYQRLCARARWSAFGELTFEQYRSWILSQPALGVR